MTKELINILQDLTGNNDVDEQTRLGDLDLDSLEYTEIIIKLDIPDENIHLINSNYTVSEIVEALDETKTNS